MSRRRAGLAKCKGSICAPRWKFGITGNHVRQFLSLHSSLRGTRVLTALRADDTLNESGWSVLFPRIESNV